jgi:hypothetical protein
MRSRSSVGTLTGTTKSGAFLTRDSFPDDDFDNAVAKTRGHDFLSAGWSNEAFELWYVSTSST